MRIKFELWIAEQKFSIPVRRIFAEAIVCYRSEAYRAAMVLSYIGFLSIIKERLLKASCPVGIIPANWTAMQRNLQNDDKWDETARDATQQKNPVPIFLVSDDIRLQILYWKNRRNDCAHFKKNEVDYHHIEAFWSFIQGNLSKLAVNGSLAAVVNRIQNHFDISLTPLGVDPSPIVEEIDSAIAIPDLPTFFVQIDAVLSAFGLINTDEALKFFHLVFQKCEVDVRTALSDFLKSKPQLVVDYLRTQPQQISELSFDASEVRQLWFSVLFTYDANDFNIYVEMLENGMIPHDELEESNRTILERVTYGQGPADFRQCSILNNNGFFEKMKIRLIDHGQLSQFTYSNKRASLISKYLEHIPMEATFVKAVCNVFSSSYYPHDTNDEIKKLFIRIPAKRAEFIRVAHQEGAFVPRQF